MEVVRPDSEMEIIIGAMFQGLDSTRVASLRVVLLDGRSVLRRYKEQLW
jgi:hypothetical protein